MVSFTNKNYKNSYMNVQYINRLYVSMHRTAGSTTKKITNYLQLKKIKMKRIMFHIIDIIWFNGFIIALDASITIWQ